MDSGAGSAGAAAEADKRDTAGSDANDGRVGARAGAVGGGEAVEDAVGAGDTVDAGPCPGWSHGHRDRPSGQPCERVDSPDARLVAGRPGMDGSKKHTRTVRLDPEREFAAASAGRAGSRYGDGRAAAELVWTDLVAADGEEGRTCGKAAGVAVASW